MRRIRKSRPAVSAAEVTPDSQWSWCESLGAVSADAGSLLEVGRIRLGMVKDRCWEMGLREGQEVRWRRRSREGVMVELPGGTVGTLEFPYAWFVEVRPIESVSPSSVSA